jgi:hypothetical protein
MEKQKEAKILLSIQYPDPLRVRPLNFLILFVLSPRYNNHGMSRQFFYHNLLSLIFCKLCFFRNFLNL